jgi:hypothetical protein
MKCLVLLSCILISTNSFSQIPENIQRYRNDAQGNYSNRRQGIMDGNNIRSIYYNNGEVAQWPYAPSMEWPKGTGHQYLDGYCFMISARVTAPGNTQIIHPLETSYREEMPSDPATGQIWGMEPIGGYMNADPRSKTPAINTDANSYPAVWPAALGLGSEWNGEWVGYFGKGSLNGIKETFYVMDDSKDGKYQRPPYLFHPIISDTTRGGLGLRVEVHGLQFSDVQMNDVIFWDYNVINISDNNYDSTVFGFYFDPGIGGVGSGNDDASFNRENDLCYTWDHLGKGDPMYGVWIPGYFGICMLDYPLSKGGNNITAMSISPLVKGATGTWPKNNEVIWTKMTGGFGDTSLTSANFSVVIAGQAFAFSKWTNQHVMTAMICGIDVSELIAKKSYSQSFINKDLPRAGGDTTLYHPANVVSRNTVGTGTLKVRILDPVAVTGHTYLLTFKQQYGDFVAGTVTDLATGIEKIAGLGPLDGAFESITFDGIRICVSNDAVALDTVRSGWVHKSSRFPISVTFDNWTLYFQKHLPYDYQLTFSNVNVDTSGEDLFPAIPIPFTVKNLTLNTKIKPLLMDNDRSHTLSKGDNVFLIEFSGSTASMVWNIGFGSKGSSDSLPTLGDVYLIASRKPFIVGDSIMFTTQGLTNLENVKSNFPYE